MGAPERLSPVGCGKGDLWILAPTQGRTPYPSRARGDAACSASMRMALAIVPIDCEKRPVSLRGFVRTPCYHRPGFHHGAHAAPSSLATRLVRPCVFRRGVGLPPPDG